MPLFRTETSWKLRSSNIPPKSRRKLIRHDNNKYIEFHRRVTYVYVSYEPKKKKRIAITERPGHSVFRPGRGGIFVHEYLNNLTILQDRWAKKKKTKKKGSYKIGGQKKKNQKKGSSTTKSLSPPPYRGTGSRFADNDNIVRPNFSYRKKLRIRRYKKSYAPQGVRWFQQISFLFLENTRTRSESNSTNQIPDNYSIFFTEHFRR